MATRKAVEEAVAKLAARIVEEGGSVAMTNVNWDKLSADIDDEYERGASGSVYDVLVDLNDSVGLDEYGIVFSS